MLLVCLSHTMAWMYCIWMNCTTKIAFVALDVVQISGLAKECEEGLPMHRRHAESAWSDMKILEYACKFSSFAKSEV